MSPFGFIQDVLECQHAFVAMKSMGTSDSNASHNLTSELPTQTEGITRVLEAPVSDGTL